MPEIKINNKAITAAPDETVLKVALREGIHIPTLCWVKELKPSTSCMVCVVQDRRNNKMITSCSALVDEGMDIVTDNDEVLEMRRTALELLLSEHYGDCEAPCQRTCPAEMNIPLMNRLIAAGKMKEALKIVKETIALPAVLGYICPAPCEKACRRKDIDEPVSICLLKRFVAEEELNNPHVGSDNDSVSRGKMAVIGAGPAGLAAAYYAARNGYSCDVFDKNNLPGGNLRAGVLKEKLPEEVLDREIEQIGKQDISFFQNQTITAEIIENELSQKYDFIVLATGAESDIHPEYFEQTDFSEIRELEIFRVKDCVVLAPKQISSKSKMAVRAAALGRKSVDWLLEFSKHGRVRKEPRNFNSLYKRIAEDERFEFLKEARNHAAAEKTADWLQGYAMQMAMDEAARCLHCDCREKTTCKLRDLSTEYKASQRVFTIEKHPKTIKNTEHDKVVLEQLKCIKCGICVQTAELENDAIGFAFLGRGFDVRIVIPIEKNIRQLSDNTLLRCAANCPTGAIALRSGLK